MLMRKGPIGVYGLPTFFWIRNFGRRQQALLTMDSVDGFCFNSLSRYQISLKSLKIPEVTHSKSSTYLPRRDCCSL